MSRYTRQQPRNRNGYEQDAPKTPKGTITPSDVWRTKQNSGAVRTWADMTPEQRQQVLATIKPGGSR